MASHVVVIDSTARRATVKVLPGKHLSDVLSEACSKLGADPNQHGLKHNNKNIDLTLPFRLTGLSSGAKLTLVQQSRSASVVSVALDIREANGSSSRLVDKFPSTTTLWQVLRRFESGVAGGTNGSNASASNLTGRSVALTNTGGNGGSGRLFYQMPVLQVMNREVTGITELQKTLSQIGITSGSALLRLSFKDTDTPMEQAVQQIAGFFQEKDVDSSSSKAPEAAPPPAAESVKDQAAPTASEPAQPIEAPAPEPEPMEDIVSTPEPNSSLSATTTQPTSPSALSSTSTPLPPDLKVYLPPTSSTLQAASTPFNPKDYIPSIQHAQTHQRLLSSASENKRLLTDAELAIKEAEAREKLRAIATVDVKIRFPDQSQVMRKFERGTTVTDLRTFVRDCLNERVRVEPFGLEFWAASGVPGVKGPGGGKLTLSNDNDERKLIEDLHMKGGVLITFTWAQSVPSSIRGMKEILRDDLRSRAENIEVNDVGAKFVQEEETVKAGPSENKDEAPKKKGLGGGTPKWLKLPGKK